MTHSKWIAVALVFVAFGLVLGTLLVTGTSGAFVLPTLVPTISLPTEPSATAGAPPAETQTPLPPKEFTICQIYEPNTLFIYGGPSRAARNVLEAIYDGPIDTRTYQFQPVILEKLPSLDDGDVVVRNVHVGEGAKVIDVNGLVVDLLPGVTVLDADGQEVTFESGLVTMTQMVVTFKLRADVTWADGQPLTVHDSRYSFDLASKFDAPAVRWLPDRTLSYEALDDHTIVWTGIPGYQDSFFLRNFHQPLPRHIWGQVTANFLLSAEVANRKPLGWGPFVVEEWVAGDHITLVRNPHYFRAAEGLPYLDRVTLRFVPGLQQALDLLVGGECDLIAQDVIEGADLAPLLEAAAAGTVQLISSPSSEWEHLDFGIEQAGTARRQNFFVDERVRQAIALCVDRERIASEAFLYREAEAAYSYVATAHPLYAGDQLHRWDYDPSRGQSLLDEAGWLDENEDGIREARSVAGVAYGTPFSATLLTTSGDPVRKRVADILVENLADCGVGLAVQFLPDEMFFADGPDGPVFGRQFDLALFSWLDELDPPCQLYLSEEIPGPENWWTRSNTSGYVSEEYDAACHAALDTLPGTDAHTYYHREAQRIFSRDLPVLPLYFVPKVVAARPEVSGVILDPSEYLELWNIEAFDRTRAAGQ
jgi:peptide/nickel transport system substrate-binding protein